MKTILVATDFSAPANNAVQYAAHIAKETGADLVLFNVFKLNIHASNAIASNSTVNTLVQKNEEVLEKMAVELEKEFGIKVGWVLRQNETIPDLRDYVNSNFPDLVVMGIQSNLPEYKLFGNTTTAAIKLMLFPLLVVPNDIQYTGINRIMYACESSYLKEDCGLGVLKEFVWNFKAELEVFHVHTSDNEKESSAQLEQLMDKLLKDVGHTYCYVSNPRVGDGIQEGLEQFPADLLVMIPHKLGFFEGLFKGSNTNQMTVKTRVPLLVIPNDKAC
ncbi:MAG: universal stress protein [Bacteroidia bacterium]|nr:universal stress protein [Bacteroidia bacterium]